MTVGGLGGIGGCDGLEHQGWAVDAIRKFFCGWELEIDRPDERHAIGRDEIEFSDRFRKLRIVAGECGDVGVGGFHRIGTICGRSLFQDPSDSSGVVGYGDGETDDGSKLQILNFKSQI